MRGVSGVSDRTAARLLLLDGIDGPAFLATAGYDAFRAYNNADAYAFAVGLLSDLLRGDPVPELRWSSGERGLSRDEVRALQQLLVARGHAIAVDGVPGALTRDAVRAEQKRLGWPETGRLEQRLLSALRG
jgi:glucose-6-phosphate 1-epimerase